VREAAGQQAGRGWCVQHGPGRKPNSTFSIGQDSSTKGILAYWEKGEIIKPTNLLPWNIGIIQEIIFILAID